MTTSTRIVGYWSCCDCLDDPLPVFGHIETAPLRCPKVQCQGKIKTSPAENHKTFLRVITVIRTIANELEHQTEFYIDGKKCNHARTIFDVIMKQKVAELTICPDKKRRKEVENGPLMVEVA